MRSEEWCGVDTGSEAFEPAWFDGKSQFLVPEDGTIERGSVMALHADPLQTYPDPLPIGPPVDVTGMFGHPAASACTVYHYFKDNTPSVHCRQVFAVTAIAPR